MCRLQFVLAIIHLNKLNVLLQFTNIYSQMLLPYKSELLFGFSDTFTQVTSGTRGTQTRPRSWCSLPMLNGFITIKMEK